MIIKPHAKIKKILTICILTISILGLVVVLLISPITKYLIEKYGEKYTGRQIEMAWVYVNPFTGYIHFSDLRIHELKSERIFFSANSASINITICKLFFNTYEISELILNQPQVIIIQKEKYFNFNDLVNKFFPAESGNATKKSIHVNLLNVQINKGEFYYHENSTPVNYFIKKVYFESTGLRWNSDTISGNFSFLPGIGTGNIKGDFTVNLKNKDYRLATIIHQFDLNIIGQYLKALTNYGSFSANMDADMSVRGNFNNEEDITSSGFLGINDFHFGKNPNEDYAAFDKLTLKMREVSPINRKYYFDSVLLFHPYLKYEQYDYLDNLQTVFGKNGSNVSVAKADASKFNLVIEIADYIKVLSRNFFQSNYRINRLGIYGGNLKFNDYSLNEKFSISLNPLSVIADSIDKNRKRVNFDFKSGIKPYGNISAALSINPKDSGDFDLTYNLQKIAASMFNPYTITYSSFPLDRGTIELKGMWNVRNGIIESKNHLVIIDPRTTKRLRNKDMGWIPVPLLLYFIRERGNVIDYEIPITGNLKSPKFHLHDVLFDLLENTLVKPPTLPYRIEVKNIETEIEKSFALNWGMRCNSLPPNEEKFIGRIADFLAKNPEVSITIYPNPYPLKEKEYILFFETKKIYFLKLNNKNILSFSKDDSMKVDRMSIKDSLFVCFLNKRVNDSMVFTVQEKCSRIIDSTIINSQFKALNKERENNFISYFRKKEVKKQIKIYANENSIPYNGFSFYKIKYKGRLPLSLLKAYREIYTLNDEVPRSKFKKERREAIQAP